MAHLTFQNMIRSARPGTDRLHQNLLDYSTAVFSMTWQRQGIYAAISILTGAFFDPRLAFLFFAINMGCELVDLANARCVKRLNGSDTTGIHWASAIYLANTIVSTAAISFYAIHIAIFQGGVGLFTALFCLFAAALHAAMNNHQLFWILFVRLTFYGASFVVITVRDLWIYRPPLQSDMWLQFFTVVFVLYFLIDCSLGFLRLYRQNLRHLEELKEEHERTKAALIVKSQFVSVVSHELRTPLTSIKGSLDLINSGKVGEIDAKVQPLLEIASKNSRRLALLVDDLLDLQKIESGEMTFKRRNLDLRILVRDAVASHEGLAKKFGITLVSEVPSDGGPVVHADESRLMQVLSNMISNAAKFSPEGSEVVVGCMRRGPEARVFVRDHGAGIPPGSEEKVFGRFMQLDSSDQRKVGGTGLGMSISREIVEALGGRISYESRVGEGSTFYFDMPAVGFTPKHAEVGNQSGDVIRLPRVANG